MSREEGVSREAAKDAKGREEGNLSRGVTENAEGRVIVPPDFPQPRGWKLVGLDSICDGIFDCPHSTPVTVGSGYFVVRTPDIITGKLDLSKALKVTEKVYLERIKRAEPHENDLLFSREGTYFGIAATIPANVKLCLGQRMVLIRPKEDNDSGFIKYWINSPFMKGYIDGFRDGSVAERLNLPTIRNLPIALPHLPEQRAIAAVLSSLDDKIDLLHRQNRTLETLAQTLFRQWFVEGADITWKNGKLPDEFEITMGQSPEGTSFNQEGIGMPMFQGNADFGFRFPVKRVFTTSPTRFADPFDVLISVRAPVGAQNMAVEKCCIGRGLSAFRYRPDRKFYTYTFFKLRSLTTEIQQFNNEGTVFGSISKSDFEALDTIIPPASTIRSFEVAAKPLNDKVIENSLQIEKIENLRDTLLPKLMTGEVRVVV